MKLGRSVSRVPLVLQSSSAECGLACLSMVLGHHRYPISVRELRDLAAPGRDGVSATGLLRAARASGMKASGHRATPETIRSLTLPVILHWGDNHFVVVERITDSHADVVDPRVGRRRLSIPEFHAGLGKAVLAVRPGEDFTPRTKPVAFWRTYLRSLLRVPGTGRLLAQVIAVSAVAQVLVVAMPLATRTVVDEVPALRGTALLTLLGAGIVLVATAQLLTALLRSSLLIYLQGRLDTAALLGFTAHLFRLPLRYFEQRSTGDIVTRFASIAMLREQMTSQTLGSLLDAALVLSYLGVLLFLDLAVALTVLAVVLTVVLVLCGTTRRTRDRMATDLATQSEAHGYLVESLEGVATLKASAAEERSVDRLALLWHNWMNATLRRGLLAAIIESVTVALRTLTPLLVLWLCTIRVLAGTMTPGTMLAVAWLASAIVSPLASVAANGQRLQLAGAQLQRLADVLETPGEHQPDGADAGHRLRGRIELTGIGFQYDPYTPPVLHDISVRTRPGERVAVVGSTGSGKTTLGMLLIGLYQPTAGEIRFDGVPAQAVDPQTLRSQIGVVLQEPFVFSGTIRDNITLRDPAVSDDEVERVARLACLHDEIVATPSGYATRLAQRGAGLSGGQRQRLALARALLRDPAILLLDEATSHLDAATEAQIQRNLRDVDCVQILIAHRLSTVRDADQILVLDDGRLTESGTHDELLALRGHYERLVAAQMDRPESDHTDDGKGGDTWRRKSLQPLQSSARRNSTRSTAATER